MGQKSSAGVPNPHEMDVSQWEEDVYLTNELVSLDYGQLKVMKNRETQQLIDKYSMFFASKKDLDYYVESYKWRLEEKQIVKTYYLIPNIRNQFCSTTYQADIYIEHPINRLSDFKDIPHPDNLYCVTAMLKGYQKLYNHAGSFPIYEEQICIDETGMVKVWFNRDLSQNYPEEYPIEPQERDSDEQEEDMVEQIIHVISENTDAQFEPEPSFLDFYCRKKSLQRIGFDEALLLVQEYAEVTGMPIPKYFISVVEIYGDQDGLYEGKVEEISDIDRERNRNERSVNNANSSKSRHLYDNNEVSRNINDHAANEMRRNFQNHMKNRSATNSQHPAIDGRSSHISQERRSHRLSYLSSNIGPSPDEQNLYKNEYTQHPKHPYQTNDVPNIWEKPNNDEGRATSQLRTSQPVFHRISTVEQEAAIRQKDLYRISEHHNFDQVYMPPQRALIHDNSMASNQSGSPKPVMASRPHSTLGFEHNIFVPRNSQHARVSTNFPQSVQNDDVQRYSARFSYMRRPGTVLNDSRESAQPEYRMEPSVNCQNIKSPRTCKQQDNHDFTRHMFSFDRQGERSEAPRRFYETVDKLVELDPQIAADMLIYI